MESNSKSDILVTGGGRSLKFWDVTDYYQKVSLIRNIRISKPCIQVTKYIPSQNLVLVIGRYGDGSIYLYKLNENNDYEKEDVVIKHHHNSIWDVIPIAKDIYCSCSSSGTFNRYLSVWNISTGKLIKYLSGHKAWTYRLIVVNDILISSSVDGTLRVWDINDDYNCLQVVNDPRRLIVSLDFYYTKNLLIGAEEGSFSSNKNELIIWSLSGKMLKFLQKVILPCQCYIIKIVNNVVVVGCKGKIIMIDLLVLKIKDIVIFPQDHKISNIIKHPKNDDIILGDEYGHVYFYNLKLKKVVVDINCHCNKELKWRSEDIKFMMILPKAELDWRKKLKNKNYTDIKVITRFF